MVPMLSLSVLPIGIRKGVTQLLSISFCNPYGARVVLFIHFRLRSHSKLSKTPLRCQGMNKLNLKTTRCSSLRHQKLKLETVQTGSRARQTISVVLSDSATSCCDCLRNAIKPAKAEARKASSRGF